MELWARADFEAMNRFIAFKRLTLVIDKMFAFTNTAAAYSDMESGSH